MYILNGKVYDNNHDLLIKAYDNIIALYHRNDNVIIVTEDKECYGFGPNKCNELGLSGSSKVEYPQKITIDGGYVTYVVMNKNKTLFLTSLNQCFITSVQGLIEKSFDKEIVTSAISYNDTFLVVTDKGNLIYLGQNSNFTINVPEQKVVKVDGRLIVSSSGKYLVSDYLHQLFSYSHQVPASVNYYDENNSLNIKIQGSSVFFDNKQTAFEDIVHVELVKNTALIFFNNGKAIQYYNFKFSDEFHCSGLANQGKVNY